MSKIIYTSVKKRTTGSRALVDALPRGIIAKIQAHYGKSYAFTYNILCGNNYTGNGMPEIATEIISFHEGVEYDKKINEILNEYAVLKK